VLADEPALTVIGELLEKLIAEEGFDRLLALYERASCCGPPMRSPSPPTAERLPNSSENGGARAPR
jgi:hypothetical protein